MIKLEINVKLILSGSGGVGKTSIMNTYVGKEFPEIYIPTIGSSIKRREYNLEKATIRINIWDIGGQRAFNPLNPVFFSNIDVAFLIFDLSNAKETLLDLQKTYLNQLMQNSPNCLTYILGNKSDLILPEDSETLMNILNQFHIRNFPLIFVSAKTGDNVEEAFESIIYNFLVKLEEESLSPELKGLSEDYLKSLNKTKSDLNNIFINLETLDSGSLYKKILPSVRKKVVKQVNTSEAKEKREIISTIPDKIKLEKIRNSIIETFKNNIDIVDEFIKELKLTPIDLLTKRIDEIGEELSKIRADFTMKLDTILNLKEKSLLVEESKKEI
ncbi:MAG: Rab family GTPase [Promethearchaeota archaeon]